MVLEYLPGVLGGLSAAQMVNEASGGGLREGLKELATGTADYFFGPGSTIGKAAGAALSSPEDRMYEKKLKALEEAEKREDVREERREARDEAKRDKEFLRQKELQAGIRRAEEQIPMFIGGGPYKARRTGGMKQKRDKVREKLMKERESAATALSNIARAGNPKKDKKKREKRIKERESSATSLSDMKRSKKKKSKKPEPLYIPTIGALSTPPPGGNKRK